MSKLQLVRQLCAIVADVALVVVAIEVAAGALDLRFVVAVLCVVMVGRS